MGIQLQTVQNTPYLQSLTKGIVPVGIVELLRHVESSA
jgi:hypothetical protein